MRESRTFIAVPPGETIREMLEDRGQTQKDFAARMGLSEKHVSKLINGEVSLSRDVAMRLEYVLGLPASFWNSLEQHYREKLQLVDEENSAEDDIIIMKSMPFAEMARKGWVNAQRALYAKVVELRKFFEVSRLTLLSVEMMPHAYRTMAETEKGRYACMAWLQKVRIDSREKAPGDVDLAALRLAASQIKPLTKEKDIRTVESVLSDTLASCGVTFMLLDHLNGSHLHGAAFCEGGRTVLGMTLRRKDADVFWFSLMHEIGHIALGHLSSRESTPEKEAAADAFAQEALLDGARYDAFTAAGSFSRVAISDYSEEEGVAPGIIVGRLQKDGHIPFSRFNDMKIQYEL